MKIEQFTRSDLNRLSPLRPEGWSDLFPEFKYYLENNFCHAVKFESAGNLAGVGAAILFEKTAWLSHIIVDSEFRNQGIGYKITEELIHISKAGGAETVLLIATELGRFVYQKFGFEELSEYIYLKRPLQNSSSDGKSLDETSPSSLSDFPSLDEFQNIPKATKSDLPKIRKLDKIISGENRQNLIEPTLKTAFVYKNKNQISGYYLPDLKEGPIYATNPTAGLELMKLKYSKADISALPSQNEVGLNFLLKNGFKITEKKGFRMSLGKRLDWEPEMFYSRIAGNYG